MLGYKFNRQRPILNYIVDFMSKDLMIVVEIDGYSHNFEEIVEKDEIKQYNLERAGFTVLRYNDEDVLENMESVMLDIEQHIINLR
jgi:very-short-patch-repair endonuclease